MLNNEKASRSGHILLCSAPPDTPAATVSEKLRSLPGILSVHDLRIWRLNQSECVASAHIIMSPLQTLTPSPLPALGTTLIRYTSTSSSEDCQGVYTAEEERTRRDGTGSGSADMDSETLNGRLKRIRQAFAGFGIEKVTVQIEEGGRLGQVVHDG